MPTVVPSRVTRKSSSLDGAGQAEVGELDADLAAPAGQQEVGRLDVAVGDALLEGVVQRPRRLHRDQPRLLRVEPAAGGDVAAQVDAVHELQGQKPGAAVLTPVVQRDDVPVRQPRRVPRLAPEALHHDGVVGHRGGKNLEGDDAVQLHVPRLVDLAHAAAGEVRNRPRSGRRGLPVSRVGTAWAGPYPRSRVCSYHRTPLHPRAEGRWGNRRRPIHCSGTAVPGAGRL